MGVLYIEPKDTAEPVSTALRAGYRHIDTPETYGNEKRAGKSPAQMVLRWHIQRGDIIFAKSVTPSRVKENFEIFDFELSDSDITEITELDKGQRTGPDPDKFSG